MSEADALFTYISGLKEAVQTQVMLHDPTDLQYAMSLADRTDSTMQLASHNQGPRQPGRYHQPANPLQHQGSRIGFLRPGAGGRLSYPVPMNLGTQHGKHIGREYHETRACYHCGMVGHLAKNCWH